MVTGAFGYLGGRIALSLSREKGYLLRLGAHNLAGRAPLDWVSKNNFDVVELDVLSQKSLDSACKDVDTVIHLAALNEIASLADPQQALLVNTLGTLKLVEAARSAGVSQFIYFSTIHVYGTPLAGRITEDTPAFPTHPYAITHRAAEDFVSAADKEKAFSGVVLRVSNGFGAPADRFIDRWTLLVNDLCRQAVTGRKLILKSSGLQGRDFISLTDITRALNHVLTMGTQKFSNCVFNLGGENSITIIEMAEIVASRCAKLFGYVPDIIRPQPLGEAVYEKIEYRIDKLKATGFSLISNWDEEIDATLRLCGQSFKKTQ